MEFEFRINFIDNSSNMQEVLYDTRSIFGLR